MADYKNQIEDFFTSKRDKLNQPQTSNSGGWRKRLKNILPSKKQFLLLPKVLSGRERYVFISLAVIAIVSFAYAPFSVFYHFTKATPDYGGSYHEGVVGEPRFINPLLATLNDADRDIANLVYAGLMKYDKDGNLVPDLAQSFDVSSDGLTYTFILKDNLKWQDNKPFTPDDIIFTINTAQNPEFKSSQQINWQGIEAKKTDSKTVQFTLKNKYAQFLNNTTLGILPQHIWQNVKATDFALSENNLKPIGSGPYMFKKLKKDSQGHVRRYELDSFKYYHDGRPYINNLIFSFFASEDEMIQAYNSNIIQGMSFVSAENIGKVKYQGRLSFKEIQTPRYFAVFFNQNQSKLLSDKNMRLALNYGTDRDKLVEQILQGKGTAVYSPILPSILRVGEIIQKYDYDGELAQRVLENSGWTKGTEGIRQKNGEELSFKLTTSDWPELVEAAQLLKAQWERIGVRMDIEILPIPQLQQVIRDRSYQALLFGEVLNINLDPFSFWHSSQKKGPGLNLAAYDNQTADKLLEEARQTLNPLERGKKYDDFQKVLLDDAPAVFLYSPSYLYAPSKYVKGNEANLISISSDRLDNVSSWYIDTRRVKR